MIPAEWCLVSDHKLDDHKSTQPEDFKPVSGLQYTSDEERVGGWLVSREHRFLNPALAVMVFTAELDPDAVGVDRF